MGDTSRAEEVSRVALRGAEEVGSQTLLAQSHHLLARTLDLTGGNDDAARHMARAVQALDEIRTEAGTDQLLSRADLKPIAEAAATSTR